MGIFLKVWTIIKPHSDPSATEAFKNELCDLRSTLHTQQTT